MAKSSEKKSKAEAERMLRMYTIISVTITVLHLLLRVLWNWDTFGVFSFIGMFTFWIVEYFSVRMVVEGTRQGVIPEYWQDLLFVNWFVHFTTVISDYFWIFYSAIPIYGLYKLWGMYRYAVPNTADDQARTTKRELKRQRKLDRANKLNRR
eukprot:752105_1